MADYLDFYADDPETAVGLAYVEGVPDGRAFFERMRVGRRAQAARAVKGGATAGGQRAAASHTGSLATDDRVFDGMCRQAGVTRAATVEEAFEAAATFATQPLPAGPRVVVMTTAGGWGVVTADAIARSDARARRRCPTTCWPPSTSSCRPAGAATTRSTWPAARPATPSPRCSSSIAAHPDVDAVIYLGLGIQANQARADARRAASTPTTASSASSPTTSARTPASPRPRPTISDATGKPILIATELAVADPDNAGPAAVRATGRLCYPSANRAVTALDHAWERARWLQARGLAPSGRPPAPRSPLAARPDRASPRSRTAAGRGAAGAAGPPRAGRRAGRPAPAAAASGADAADPDARPRELDAVVASRPTDTLPVACSVDGTSVYEHRRRPTPVPASTAEAAHRRGALDRLGRRPHVPAPRSSATAPGRRRRGAAATSSWSAAATRCSPPRLPGGPPHRPTTSPPPRSTSWPTTSVAAGITPGRPAGSSATRPATTRARIVPSWPDRYVRPGPVRTAQRPRRQRRLRSSPERDERRRPDRGAVRRPAADAARAPHAALLEAEGVAVDGAPATGTAPAGRHRAGHGRLGRR